MKLKLYTFLFTALTLLAASCKTARKLYEKGNYTEAVELAAKKLQKDPDDPKLLAIIQDAYGYAVNDHESRIRSQAESSNELKWESMYNEYVSLQRMYDAIYKVPAVFNLVKPVNYSSFVVTYASKAAEVRYERAIALMEHYDKQNYRQAYRELQVALRLQPGDSRITTSLNEAWNGAVTNVVVLPMQQSGGFVYSSYTPGAVNLDDQVVRDLQYNSGNEFVKVYSAWEARSKQVRVDQEVDLRFITADIGRQHDERSSRKVSRQVVVKETVIRPDSIVREYAQVYATIFTTRRTMSSTATLQLTIRDENGRWMWSDDIRGHHDWSTEFAYFTGDARALSEADRQLVDRHREIEPSEYDIMRCLVDQVSNDAHYRLRNYFSQL